jgi:hypothetical protein
MGKEDMSVRFPLKFVVEEKTGKFKASTSIDVLLQSSRNVRLELAFFEIDYSLLIRNAKDALASLANRDTKDARIYWLVGDAILRFLERIEDCGFYLFQQNRTLARDIGVSESSIKKVLSFRRRFPRISMVDPTIPWARYRENKVLASEQAVSMPMGVRDKA